MATLAEETGGELENFRREGIQLQKELQQLLRSTGSYSREKLMETKERIKEAIYDLKNQVSQKASSAYVATKGYSNFAVKKSRDAVSHRPFTSIAVAFVAGVVLAKLIKRRHAS